MPKFKTILAKLARQKNMSPHIGAVLNVYSVTGGVIYAPLTFMGVATTIYGLWGGEIIREWLPWFTFPVMLGCIVLIVLIMMSVFYKVIIPSQVAFSMRQQYKHRNPLVADMQQSLANDEKILGKLDDMDKRLKELEGRK